MNSDDTYNTSLVLGLGFSPSTNNSKPNPTSVLKPDYKITFQPTMTLSLSGAAYNYYGKGSATSSFSLSNISVKREREAGSDQEVEIERVSLPKTSDHDDEIGFNGRKKLRLTKAQSALLEESFKKHSSLNPKEKQELARNLKLRTRQVEVWFQNRRARTKLKQTEVDYEMLKKWRQKLTVENRRLQKELLELKSSQPLYMQLPAGTLSMCPSCETSTPENATNKRPYAPMAQNSHFCTPFMNPSAAC